MNKFKSKYSEPITKPRNLDIKTKKPETKTVKFLSIHQPFKETEYNQYSEEKLALWFNMQTRLRRQRNEAEHKMSHYPLRPWFAAYMFATRGIKDLLSLMVKHTKAWSLYYTDDWHAYTLLNVRGNHVVITKDKVKQKGRDHVNGIEKFWQYAKNWLYHYLAVPRKYCHLSLKEIEWRFNQRNENLVLLLRKRLTQPLVKKQF